ncbi:MAG: T9SS type A sorting domain-containing protein [Prolixibacteraceae bacterium]|jgi:hypothetical protein|nr:T9SS type A sorting domain-containing protein [Prolixibacteraceae bacterium]
MKKIILFLLFITIGLNAYCQHELDYWDWTKDESYDDIFISGETPMSIPSPFTSQSIQPNLTHIRTNKDYLPEKGWVLITKDFGAKKRPILYRFPYFILYNKYTSILRLYAYNQSQNEYTKALISLKWDKNFDETSLLTHGNVYGYANDHYMNKKRDEGINHINYSYIPNGWFYADFFMAFDHNTSSQKNYFLNFDIYPIITSKITAESILEADIVSKDVSTSNSALEEKENNDNGNKVYDFVKDTKNIISKIPTSKEIDKGLNKMSKDLEKLTKDKNAPKLITKLNNINKKFQAGNFLKGIKKVADIASSAVPVISAISSAFDFFIDSPETEVNKPVVMAPMVMTGKSTINGTIETKTYSASLALEIPGSKHNKVGDRFISGGTPVYDCPLGVISLEKTPNVSTVPLIYRSYSSKGRGPYTISGKDHNYILGVYKWFPAPALRELNLKLNHYNESNLKLIKIDDDIKIAFNTSSQLYIKSIKAQLISEEKEIHIPKCIEIEESKQVIKNAWTLKNSMYNKNKTRSYSYCSTYPLRPRPNNISGIPKPRTLSISAYPDAYLSHYRFYNMNKNETRQFNVLNNKTNKREWVIYQLRDFYSDSIDSIYVHDQVRTGKYELLGMDTTHVNDKIYTKYKYGTKLIDINKFKGTSFIVNENDSVFLKLVITLKKKDNSAKNPFVFYTLSYKLDSFTDISNSITEVEDALIPNYELISDTIKAKSKTLIDSKVKLIDQKRVKDIPFDIEISKFNPSEIRGRGRQNSAGKQTVKIQALNSIVIKKGATIKATKWESFQFSLYKRGTNALELNEYFNNCNCYPYKKKKSRRSYIKSKNSELKSKNISINIFPNPVCNLLNIRFQNTELPQRITIFDSLGQIKDNLVIDSPYYQFNVSDYPKGIYIIKCIENNQSTKFIKE